MTTIDFQLVVLNTAQHVGLNSNKSHWDSFSPSSFVFSSHCHSITVQHTHAHTHTHIYFIVHIRHIILAIGSNF